MTTAAIFGKWVAAFATQLVFRYSTAQRLLIFGLSNAQAAATLAAVLIGYKAGILDKNILNGTIIMILITCIIASFATEKAAKKIVIESENDTDGLVRANGLQNEHILLPIANISNFEKLLELAIFIKDKKSVNPVSILSVVPYSNEVEINILKTRNKLEEIVKQASATETKINIITTIDHNAASGISRISREIMANIIVLGWPQRTGFIDKLIGEKVDSILNNTDKTTFICHLEKPLFLHKRIIIVAPPLTEHENGFGLWVTKIARLAQELNIPILLYCNATTEKAIERLFKKAKLSASISIKLFTDWDDFLVLSRNIHEDDLFVLVSARKGATSYLNVLDNLPVKLEKHFATNSRFVVYPQQYANNISREQYNDISSVPLNKGIKAVQRIGKDISSIFKKNDNE
jgi:hypothetical protein